MSMAGQYPPDLRDLVSIPKFLGSRPSLARAVRGTTPSGDEVICDVRDARTILLFLSTSCAGCGALWQGVSDPLDPAIPEGVRTVIVTHGRGTEVPDTVTRLSGGATVIMSDDAWTDYEVQAGPFFVVIDGASGRIVIEGVAWSIPQIVAAITAAGAGG